VQLAEQLHDVWISPRQQIDGLMCGVDTGGRFGHDELRFGDETIEIRV
jgi:hypothetical protein